MTTIWFPKKNHATSSNKNSLDLIQFSDLQSARSKFSFADISLLNSERKTVNGLFAENLTQKFKTDLPLVDQVLQTKFSDTASLLNLDNNIKLIGNKIMQNIF